jgi:hypothetical protein
MFADRDIALQAAKPHDAIVGVEPGVTFARRA